MRPSGGDPSRGLSWFFTPEQIPKHRLLFRVVARYSNYLLSLVHLPPSTMREPQSPQSAGFQCPLLSDCRLPSATTSDFHRPIVPPYERLIRTTSTSLKHQLSAQSSAWSGLETPLMDDGLTSHIPTVMAHPICEYVQNRAFYLPRRSPSLHLLPSFHCWQ